MSLALFNSPNGNPLELPEIMNLIVNYVSHRDIPTCIKCIRVSKAWYRVFVPLIWNEVCYSGSTPAPTESGLARNADVIASLTIRNEVPAFVYSTQLPRLQKLTILANRSMPIIQLLNSCSTVRELTLAFNQSFSNQLQFWESLSRLNNLKKLSISHLNVSPESVDAFWSTLTRLNGAVLNNVSLQSDFSTQLTDPQELTSLSMSAIPDSGLDGNAFSLIKICTALEYLNLDASFQAETVVDLFTKFTWPQLHKLTLSSDLDPIQLQKVISSFTRLTAFKVPSATWGLESFNTLANHFSTLELLLAENNSFTSLMVNTVMSSCPNLQVLSVPTINGTDIIEGRHINGNSQPNHEWACIHLRELTTKIDMQGVTSQISLMERLASLTELERLDIHRSQAEEYTGLLFSLDEGLYMLEPLQKLRQVTFGGNMQSMNEADVNWIINNWKSLRSFTGTLNKEYRISQVLHEKIVSQKIYCNKQKQSYY